jgi:hypothetical protein
MTSGTAAEDVARRSRRKQDLLMASALARGQAIGAIDQISRRADLLVNGYRQVQAWASVPHVGGFASVAASVAALIALRNVRLLRLLRWGLLGWRVSRLAINLVQIRSARR